MFIKTSRVVLQREACEVLISNRAVYAVRQTPVSSAFLQAWQYVGNMDDIHYATSLKLNSRGYTSKIKWFLTKITPWVLVGYSGTLLHRVEVESTIYSNTGCRFTIKTYDTYIRLNAPKRQCMHPPCFQLQ